MTYEIIRKAILSARKSQEVAQAKTDKVYRLLDGIGTNLEADSKAENATILGDAISCFIDYDEYGIDNIMEEIEAATEGEK
jgi:hypothetical protein